MRPVRAARRNRKLARLGYRVLSVDTGLVCRDLLRAGAAFARRCSGSPPRPPAVGERRDSSNATLLAEEGAVAGGAEWLLAIQAAVDEGGVFEGDLATGTSGPWRRY